MRNIKWLYALLVVVLTMGAMAGCAPAAAPAPAAPAPEAAAPEAEAPAEADPARVVRTLELYTQDQGSDAQEFEMGRYTAESLKPLGLDIELKAQPWEQLLNVIWYQRDVWDFTMWQMVGRPERSDPDELIYNLFHTSTAESGYNFIGYLNPEYDEVIEAQRAEIDPGKRLDLVKQAQEMIALDQPYTFYVHQYMDYVVNNTVWNPDTFVEQAGIGAKNFWTFIGAEPVGDQRDMVLVSGPIIDAINPLYISGGTDSWLTELVWDRLMRVGPDGLAKPWAAEKVEWIDGQTVDVTIREGMTWHDGQPVTLDDVIFSFTAPMGEEAPMYKPFVSRIESIEPTGPNTVRFTLNAPYVAFETASLAKLNLIPKHIWEPILADLADNPDNAESYQEEVPIGSGPFKYVAWKASEEVILEANPDHFSPPKMERWVLRFIANPEAVLGMMHSGELNFVTFYAGDPQLLIQEVESDSNLTMISTVELGSRFLAYNNRRAPFSDPVFRRALAMTIEKDGVVNGIYKGRAVESDSIVSKSMAYWHNDELTQWTGGVDAARAYLAENGYEWDADGRLMYPEGQVEELDK